MTSKLCALNMLLRVIIFYRKILFWILHRWKLARQYRSKANVNRVGQLNTFIVNTQNKTRKIGSFTKHTNRQHFWIGGGGALFGAQYATNNFLTQWWRLRHICSQIRKSTLYKSTPCLRRHFLKCTKTKCLVRVYAIPHTHAYSMTSKS